MGEIRSRIADACARAGREASSVTLLAVTKAVDIAIIRTAVELGVADLAENRVQEAEAKVAGLPQAHWQLVGHLQSNKAARAVALFEAIQSVDSVELADKISRHATELDRTPYPVYLQVNVDRDPTKTGFEPAALETALPQVCDLPGLDVRGLMTVGRLVDRAEDARPTFVALRELAARLRHREARLGQGLSMGMSDDFEVAIEEGATVVRIGRALFGERYSGLQ
ncbi:MAG: YggS family pyridoxal phosphate-dependent enzyme [Chloroflexota bacterium]